MTIYKLYYNEAKFELVISPWREGKSFDGVKQWNDCIYISCERKLLREKAREIKDKWISKREKELEVLNNVKIKNKY